MLHSDQPIRQERDDLLGRSTFARKLLESVSAFRSRDNLIVSLCGRWGSGKTSVLNLFKNGLLATDLVLFEFNPWFFSGERDYGARFIVDLAQAVVAASSGEPEGSDLLEQARRYASALSPKLDEHGEGLPTLKGRLDELFSRLGRRVVVLVDDVDRLSPEEIRHFFRLIKLCGDFPNLTYVLAYDDEVVAEALAGPGRVDGHAFLEKIVQVEVRIPTPEGTAIHQVFSVMLEDVFRDYDVDLSREDLHRLADVYERHLTRVLVNLRKVKRYLNSLAFHLSILKGEVDTVDFAILEALRIFHPTVYSHVQEHRRHFAGVPDPLDAAIEGGGILDEGLVRGVPAEDRELVRGLVSELSYRYRAQLEAMDFQAHFDDELRRRRRFASPSYVDKYFILGVATGEYSDRHLDERIARLSEQADRGVEILEALLAEAARDGRAMSLLRKLDDRIDRLSPACLSCLAEALLRTGNRFVSELQALGGMITPATVAARLLRRILPRLVPLEDPCEMLEREFRRSENLLFAMTLFPLRSPLVGEGQQVVSPEEERFLADQLLARLDETLPRGSDWLAAFPGGCLRVALEAYRQLAGEARARKVVSSFLRSKRFRGAFLEAFVERRPCGTSLSGETEFEFGALDEAGMLRFADFDRLQRLWRKAGGKIGRPAVQEALDKVLGHCKER